MMGITNEGTFFPESTGAVEPPPAQVEYSQPVDQTPTGAVDGPPESVTTKFGPSGLRSTNTVTIPETITYTNTSVKVVNPPEQQQVKGETTAETDQTPRPRKSTDTGSNPTVASGGN